MNKIIIILGVVATLAAASAVAWVGPLERNNTPNSYLNTGHYKKNTDSTSDLRNKTAVQIFCAYISWGGPQYGTAANMEAAIRVADEFVKKLKP